MSETPTNILFIGRSQIKTNGVIKNYKPIVFDGQRWLLHKSNISVSTLERSDFVLDVSFLDSNYFVLS